MNQLLCLLCGRPLPPSARDGETLGPLLCDRHTLDEARSLGVLGFPNLPEERFAPVDTISAKVRGQQIVAARQSDDPKLLILELGDHSQIVLFTFLYRTSFAQYIPGTAVAVAALGSLRAVAENDGDLGAVHAAVRAAVPLVGLQYGVDQEGAPSSEILTLHFAGDYWLDVESVGYSFYEIGSTGHIAVFWRDGRSPGPNEGGKQP